jgi:transposase
MILRLSQYYEKSTGSCYTFLHGSRGLARSFFIDAAQLAGQSDPEHRHVPHIVADFRARGTECSFFDVPGRGPESKHGGLFVMDTLYRRCAGLDVHKETVQACVRILDGEDRVKEEIRGFGTMTRELTQLRDWLRKHGVTHVAMESTGVYWKPIYNILEDHFEVLLVNARHVRNVPGRKTDVKDCQWLAHLLQCGLLKASFIPSRILRELRDLTRHRKQITGEQTRAVNRIHKTLEDANVKLSSVATDIMGVSGREIIEALIAGVTDPDRLAEAARGRLQQKTDRLKLAVEGKVNDHHRFMLRSLMNHVRYLESQIEEFDRRIEDLMRPFAEEAAPLKEVPGLSRRTVEDIVSEIGVDMSRFPSDGHLSAWVAISPGNNASAGKRKSGKTSHGNRWLRSTLVQAAWAASRTKGSYFQAQFARLAKRRGRKRALVAVAHSLLVVIYHMLKDGTEYRELGANFFDRLHPEKIARYHLRRLQELGYTVTVESSAAA